MCRLAAYSGPAIPLARLFTEPPHSLLRQSWAPREMREGVVNADGFGFGWYATTDGEPAVYLNTCPAWTDPNLDVLCRSLESEVWLANVRSATPGQGLSHANTQPFTDGRVMFLHNGLIGSFRERGRPRLHRWLRPEIQAGIRGETDSEFLFAVLRQCLSEAGDLKAAFLAAARALPEILDGTRVLFNVVCCDGENLLACRYAINGGDCPSLYVAKDTPAFPHAVLVASEPLDDGHGWTSLDPHSWLSARHGVITGGGALPA